MKFGEMIKQEKPDLLITKRHSTWMESNSNPVYSGAALEHAHHELVKQAVPRDRRGTFSASSLNSCRRRQQFQFLGLPELPPTPKTAAIFQNGTFMHIRWQMAGLTEGWLTQAEVPLGENPLRLHGTQDGIAWDGSVVEFKSINSYGFSQVMTFGAKDDHLAQVGTYVACTGAHQAVLLYEDKNTQEFTEIVVPRAKLPITQVAQQAEELWEQTESETLYEPLPSCIDKEGFRYNNCPFKDQCLKIRNWEECTT